MWGFVLVCPSRSRLGAANIDWLLPPSQWNPDRQQIIQGLLWHDKSAAKANGRYLLRRTDS